MIEKDLVLVPGKETVNVSVNAIDPGIEDVTDPVKDLEIETVTGETGIETVLLVVIKNGLEIVVESDLESDPENDLGIEIVSVPVLPPVVVLVRVRVLVVGPLASSI